MCRSAWLRMATRWPWPPGPLAVSGSVQARPWRWPVSAPAPTGGLWRLDDYAPPGLARFEAPLAETWSAGPQGESGPWQVPGPDAPRACGIVAPPAGKTWGDGGPPRC